MEEVLETIAEWLRTSHVRGEPETFEDLADIPWEVEKIAEDGHLELRAINPLMPALELRVAHDPATETVRLRMHTGIVVADLEPEEKLRVFRRLLYLNAAPMVKAYLQGPDREIIIAADLSTRSMSEDELNQAIALMSVAYLSLYKELGREDVLRARGTQHLIELVEKKLREGWSRERLREYLVRKAGLDPEAAEALVETVIPRRAGGDKMTHI